MRRPTLTANGRRPISDAPVRLRLFSSLFSSGPCCVLTLITCSEALAELQSLQEAADDLANFVHALMGHRQERLLSARMCVRQAIESDVRHGAAVALMMAQAATDAKLTDVEGFPPGQGLADYVDHLPDFEPAVNVVAAIIPASQILNEDL